MTLDLLAPGAHGQILEVDNTNPNLARLAELGLIAGQEVTLIQKAPLGDPIKIRIMNYELCIRREDATGINISPDGEAVA